MGSIGTKPPSGYWKRLLQLNHATNTGFAVGGALTNITSGDGLNSSLSLTDDHLLVQPLVDDSTTALDIKTKSGASILTADTTNKRILTGESQVSVNTHFKEFGIYQVSPNTGFHQGLIANNMIIGNDNDDSLVATALFGNDVEPAETIDVSVIAKNHNLVAYLWYIENNITIDTVRFIACVNSASDTTVNFHLMSYSIDTSGAFGDLSAGTVISDGTVDAKITTVKTGTFSHVGDVNVDAGKVMVCTYENTTGTDVMTFSITVKYHIR